MQNKNVSSYITMICTMLVFGTIGIFRRYIPVSSGMLACSRGFLGAIVLVVFVKLKRRKLFHGIGIKKTLLLALTGGLMGANWILLFEAYNYTTVATATLCYYMQPTIVILLSPILFSEKLTAKKYICAAVALVGMVFVSGVLDTGGAGASNAKGVLLGLGAAALYASVIIMNKKVHIEDAYEKTMIQLVSAAVVLVPYLLLTEDISAMSFTPMATIMLLVVGIFHTGIAYVMYFSSMTKLSAQSTAVLSYIDPISAMILSALILHENLTWYGLIGAVFVIGAAFISEVSFKESSGKTVKTS